MSDSKPPSSQAPIQPWTIWVPIIIMALGLVVFYNYAVMQSIRQKDQRPPYLTRLETDLEDLTERSGKKVKLSDLKGKVMIIAHVYTTCPMGCATIVEEMKKLHAEFGKDKNLHFVSVAIDPNDDATRMKQYAEGNEIKSEDQWWFINGDQTKIRRYLTQVLKFYTLIELPPEQQTSVVDKYKHDMRIALVDAAGHLRGMHDILNSDEQLRELHRAKLRKDIAYVLKEAAAVQP
jgi:cytochrome oxidase Cu insertion factor (SCO1/SenC/PrrC family)